MARKSKMKMLTRTVALALVTLYIAASGRGMLPRVLEFAGANTAEGSCCANPGGSCCVFMPDAPRGADDDGPQWKTASSSLPSCPLCSLANMPACGAAGAFVVSQSMAPHVAPFERPAFPALPTVWEPAAPRAPPIA